VATEGAVWYARRIGAGSFSAVHVPGKDTDTGIKARWFDLTGGEHLRGTIGARLRGTLGSTQDRLDAGNELTR
jgi:hypothetical protein